MKLRMNSWARERITTADFDAIEADIPEGYFLTVQAGLGDGDWSVRAYQDDGTNAPAIVSKHHRTIFGGCASVLVRLAAAA